jgi:hypothetical protein
MGRQAYLQGIGPSPHIAALGQPRATAQHIRTATHLRDNILPIVQCSIQLHSTRFKSDGHQDLCLRFYWRRVELSDVAEGCVCHHCAAQLRDIGGPYSPHSALGDAVQQAFLKCFQRTIAALRHSWSVWLPTDEQEALRNVPLCWLMRLSHHLILFAGTWLYEAAFSSLRLRNFSMQQPAVLNIHCGAF